VESERGFPRSGTVSQSNINLYIAAVYERLNFRGPHEQYVNFISRFERHPVGSNI
jgi:hypothetical protein